MSNIKRIFLILFLSLICVSFGYLYIWEKPKLEKIVENYVESLSKDESVPFNIDIGKTNFSIIPLQVELYDTQLKPKKELSKTLDNFDIKFIAVQPSLIDLFVGKFWISHLHIKGSQVNIKINPTQKNSKTVKTEINLNSILKRIPLSQVNIQDIQLDLNVFNQHFIKTENLFIKAYNEKSSLIITLKDPNIQYKNEKSPQFINFLADLQMMATKDSLSLSKLKIVKDSSYFLASGNLLYSSSPLSMQEAQIKTRIKSDFEKLKVWSNQVYKNNYFDSLKGLFKTDINLSKIGTEKNFSVNLTSSLDKLQVGKVKIGQIDLKASMPTKELIQIDSVKANLSGNNKVLINNGKVTLGKKTTLSADLELKDTQLQSFLKDSGISDVPVWLKINGNLSCNGFYDKKLSVDCPGALTLSNVKIKNASRTKTIVAAKKLDVAGNINISESAISYKANAKLPETKGKSNGVIDFEKGFKINYETDNLNFAEIGQIGELEFLGTAKCKGSTQGDSHSATFFIDIEGENFEFEKYFFGALKSRLSYKSGVLYFDNLNGNIESTRYNGNLSVNLLKDNIKGDIQLPFFRMSDVQQSIAKKVDLKQRFLGSGSGRIQLDTPFEIDRLNFHLDARLFKGKAFGEDYNEAKLKAQAVDGIIIIQQGLLQKEKTSFNLKGTLDTKLQSQFQFTAHRGFLQHSSLMKTFNIPLAGEFDASGQIYGPLENPIIKTKAKIKNLIFNKKKYGESLFNYDNSNKQTNLQFNIPNQLDFLILIPEDDASNYFVNLTANKLDVAPLVGFLVSEDATRSYTIETSGELSGQINTQDWWESEFSSTIKEISLDYKSNKIVSTIPTNIELKNNNLFFNELSLVGKKQFIKITQPYTSKYSTKFIINARINIAFFKLLAPFIEKIDGFSTLRLELSFNHKNLKLIGSSYTTDSFLKFPGFPHAFESLNADILFNQNKVLINSISGELAGGKVLGNGEVNFKGAKDFDLLINTNMEDINLSFPEGFNTKGRASISLSGSGLPFTLSGNYTVTEGLIDNNFNSSSNSNNTDLLEELLKKEISSPLLLNLDIKTENSVEVRNSLVEGYIEGDFKVYDKITTPKIKGEAHFEDDSISTSIVKFNENEFEVTSSSFIFEGKTPINPKLSLRSKTRLNSYDIDLFLQGRASKPLLTISSQPPLPETQIISMLALGQLPDQFDQTSGNNVNNTDGNSSAGFEIGTSLLGNNPLGKEIKDRTGFDVQFSSSFDDQSNAAVPKITVRRKVTKKLQISFSQATGSSSQSEGRVSYELNNQLSTIFRVTNFSDDSNNTNNTNSTRQNNPFGIDLEYKLEFD